MTEVLAQEGAQAPAPSPVTFQTTPEVVETQVCVYHVWTSVLPGPHYRVVRAAPRDPTTGRPLVTLAGYTTEHYAGGRWAATAGPYTTLAAALGNVPHPFGNLDAVLEAAAAAGLDRRASSMPPGVVAEVKAGRLSQRKYPRARPGQNKSSNRLSNRLPAGESGVTIPPGGTHTGGQNLMEVQLDDLRRLLTALGHKTAGAWKDDDPRWATYLGRLPAFMADARSAVARAAAELTVKDPALRQLLDDVVRQAAGEGVFDIRGATPPGEEGEGVQMSIATASPDEAGVAAATKPRARKGRGKDKGAAAGGEAAKKAARAAAGPSNKEKVYKIWHRSPEKFDAKKVLEQVAGEVKLSTIRNWVSGWARGNNLPAYAKNLTPSN